MNCRLATTLLAASASLAALATPASASVVFDQVGDTVTLNFNGFGDDQTFVDYVDDDGNIIGLSASQTMTLTGIVGSTFTFSYTLKNTSASPVTASRISVFGFTSSPDILDATTTSTVFGKDAQGNVPEVTFDADACFTAGPNCAGGGGGGVKMDNPLTLADESTHSATFSLLYAPGTSAITLDNFFVRYQSLNVGNLMGESAVGLGTPVTPVPEPATWAFMIVGFGAVGSALRIARRGSRAAVTA